MAMKKAPSRLEVNKDIRRILVRHSVDTTKLQFTCSGKLITMTGGIYGEGGKELTLSNIDAIFKDITRMGMRVYCELENWTITDGSISKKGGNNKGEQKNASSNQAKKEPTQQAPQQDKKAA
jgi:hypothetical protein